MCPKLVLHGFCGVHSQHLSVQLRPCGRRRARFESLTGGFQGREEAAAEEGEGGWGARVRKVGGRGERSEDNL